jgi:phosphoribosylformylglycinamidine cyclo-ligase
VTDASRDDGLTYRAAGVDIDAGERAVERIKRHVESTHRPEVVGGIGGFGSLFRLPEGASPDVLLVSSTDGVGTKSKIAQLTGRFDTIGIDCVAMSVDDIAAQGAEPLFFLDYVSVGELDPESMDAIVGGVAEGCRQARCALVGGEMSEHPGLLEPGEFDLVGFAVGIVEPDRVLPRDVSDGDVLVGLASPGLRCNGYSLARRALLDRAGRRIGDPAWPGADRTLGDELLLPSVIYAAALGELGRAVEVHALAHVTGGGIPGNLARVLPPGLGAGVRRGAWPEPRIFSEVQAAGDVSDAEMAAVFNLGVGMIAVLPAAASAEAVSVLADAGVDAWPIGEVVEGDHVVVA